MGHYTSWPYKATEKEKKTIISLFVLFHSFMVLWDSLELPFPFATDAQSGKLLAYYNYSK